MADGVRFDGRVALVTGAGGGLGKEYALAFATRGASVVVNDLGGSGKGEGKSSAPADKVVAEIRARGGTAVANYDSVEDGEKVVKTALDKFGRIDIVVNNAGILRDRSFARISDLDWDLVHRVHLRGAFKVSQAAWPHMKKQKYGKIIMTSSNSGVYGNFGQANYSAAKLGLVGLSNTLAIEGAKYGISCNTIIPTAGSRLTQSIMPPDLFELFKPEYAAPLVLYLCHDSCHDTGGLFEAAAGWVAKLQWQRTQGKLLRRHDKEMTPEMVRDNWAEITNWSGATRVSSSGEATATLIGKLEELNEGAGSSGKEDVADMVEKAKSHTFPPQKFAYEAKDLILYALGVGVSAQQDLSHLKFLYEGSEEFCALPSFGVIPAQSCLHSIVTGEVKGLNIDPTRILHGEQYLELYKPLPTSGTLTNKVEIADVMDKGKGAVILQNVTSYDEKGEPVCFNQFSIYAGGAGGFGGKRNSDKVIPLGTTPTRAPDASIREQTGLSQAALYRLSGDYNPLHIDPGFAQMGGFSTPILHGLVSFGLATRHVLKQFANNDVTKFKAIKVRFVKPVIPGQTIQTDMWKDGNRVHVQCKVVETGAVVLSSAYVDLIGLQDNKVPDVNALISNPTTSGLKSEAMFDEFTRRISSRPELVKKIKGVFLWNVTKDGKTVGQWTVDLKNGAGGVAVGPPKAGSPDCSITVSDDDLVAIATGKSNPQQLFMKGKLKVKGNILLTTKLDQLFQQERSKL